jgi:hypothetical protein
MPRLKIVTHVSNLNKCCRFPFSLDSALLLFLSSLSFFFLPIANMYRLFASAALVATASAVTTNYTSTVDPTKINIPNTPQTTSYDVATECTYYAPPVPILPTDWPSNWQVATSNGMNTSAEYTALYNSINWASAPNIQPRTMGANGALVTTGYDTVNDPDCWWTASQCVTPKAPGVLKDIAACPEPGML